MSRQEEYRGHQIQLPDVAEGPEAEPSLLIDGQPFSYGRLPDGRYALDDYAYDWHENLMDLARSYIDYQDRSEDVRRAQKRG
jgi:hypothetical protein